MSSQMIGITCWKQDGKNEGLEHSLLSAVEVLKGYLDAHLDCNLVKMLGLKWLSESGGVFLEGSLEEVSPS